MLQIIFVFAIFAVIVIPLGKYLFNIADNRPVKGDFLFNKADNLIYKVCSVDLKEMSWKRYAFALVLTNLIMLAAGYVILKIQYIGILNPNGVGSMESSLALNTAVSFMTNTNLQHYSGESGVSYLSQIAVMTFMMFTSAATGYSACMAFIRAITGRSMGNYYADMVRVTTRVLLPLAVLVSLVLVWQGVPQNFSPNLTVNTLEGGLQDIASGPVASLESIKHLGTNGGGFIGANSSAPLENPTPLTNVLEMLSMMILPGACVTAFGMMILSRKKENLPQKTAKKTFFGADAKSIFTAMSVIFLLGAVLCYYSEKAGNPVFAQAGISQSGGNMEGKEVRFGAAGSALFTAVTTCFTTGSVNNMHDSLTPLGGAVPLLNMMLNVVFGGFGCGLMGMLMYVLLTVFLCGLMIGRTPEYLGKKIEAREMKLIALCLILHPLIILAFSAFAVSIKAGLGGISNPGFHGFSQIIYEYASSAANNGSGFEGLKDNTFFWNTTTASAMFLGRYAIFVIQLAVAGSLLAKKNSNESSGSLKTDTYSFAAALTFVVLVFAALTFLPALALGPVAEYLTL